MMRRLFPLVLLVLSACDPNGSPVQPEAIPGLAILDGSREGGNPSFRWLAPIVKGAAVDGAFDASLLPLLSVDICEWDGVACLGGPIRSFTPDGEGSERLRISDGDDQHYIVDWHTGDDDLDPDAIYRISVRVGSLELGYADIDVVRRMREAAAIDEDAFVAVGAGRTLPIKFWIAEGAVWILDLQDGAVRISVPSGALTVPTELTAVPSSVFPAGTGPLPGTVFDFGPDGTQFALPIEITVSYDPNEVPPGVPEEGLRLFVLADGIWEVLDGFVDTNAKTITGLTDHFSTFGTLSLAQFCPGSPGPTTFETIADALDATIPGGTIEVCAGTHTVEGAVIDQAVTIQAEAGASPVIETSVEFAAFFLNGFASGTVLFDGLTFDVSTPRGGDSVTAYAIRGEGTYDGLVVRNSTFNIDPVSRGSVFLWTNTVTGATTLIENTTFNGGFFGIATFDTAPDAQLNVRNSQFFGNGDRALVYIEASGRIENSTFTDCYGGQCILVREGSHVEIVSNDFAAPDLTGLVAPPVFHMIRYQAGSTGLVDDNDFGGCGEFRCIQVLHLGTQVDITNNRFQVDPSDRVNVQGGHSILRYQLDATGTVQNNQLTGCFWTCIDAQTGADVVVRGNSIDIPAGHTPTWAILALGPSTSMTIEDNTIRPRLSPAPDDLSTYQIRVAGIGLIGARATVHRNTIEGAARGVLVADGGEISAGEDNAINQSFWGVMIQDGGSANLNFNDIRDSFFSIRIVDPGASDLRCNWWGDPLGPGSTVSGTVDPALYTQWSTAPIAGTDHSGCVPTGGGGTDASVPVVDLARRPTVSPDGQSVAFEVRNGVDPVAIAKVPASGGTVEPLTTSGGQPDWQNGGDLIVFRGADGASLWTVDATTTQVSFLATGNVDDEPEWSPDDSEIAVEGSSPDGIEIVSYPGGVFTPVACTQSGGCNPEHPTWSPDGTEIAFYHNGRLDKLPRVGGTPTTILSEIAGDPAWSPDGTWIAFTRSTPDTFDCELVPTPACAYHIWVVDARGPAFGLIEVTDGAFYDSSPAWSPDSGTIYFERTPLSGGDTSIRRIAFGP